MTSPHPGPSSSMSQSKPVSATDVFPTDHINPSSAASHSASDHTRPPYATDHPRQSPSETSCESSPPNKKQKTSNVNQPSMETTADTSSRATSDKSTLPYTDRQQRFRDRCDRLMKGNKKSRFKTQFRVMERTRESFLKSVKQMMESLSFIMTTLTLISSQAPFNQKRLLKNRKAKMIMEKMIEIKKELTVPPERFRTGGEYIELTNEQQTNDFLNQQFQDQNHVFPLSDSSMEAAQTLVQLSNSGYDAPNVTSCWVRDHFGLSSNNEISSTTIQNVTPANMLPVDTVSSKR